MSLDHDDDLLNTLSSSSRYANQSKLESKLEAELAQLEQQRAEIARRQQMEYLGGVISDNATTPVFVRNVQITNGQAYRSSFLQSQFNQFTNKQPLTLAELMRGLDRTCRQFQKLGMVDQCVVQLHQVNGRQLSVVPVFNTVPIKRFFAKTGTNIGNGEGDGYIQFQLRNLFGGGEHLAFDAVTGTKTNSSYLLNYRMPIANNGDHMFDISAYSNSRQHDWFGSNVYNRGITTKIYSQYDKEVSPINHDLSLETCFRTLDNLSSKSSDVILQSGVHLKTSLLYNAVYDTRDNAHLPFRGQYARLGLEHNGFTSLVKFPYSKLVAETQSAHSLGHHQLIFTNKAGVIVPHSKYGTSIMDRFFIGGPNDVRAFLLNGLGPKQFTSAVGGNTFFNGGVSLVSPIPWLKDAEQSGFRLHSFINYGKLVATTDVHQLLTKGYSSSIGVGILFNHPMARFELNFVLPVTAHQRDLERKGLQWGIGVSFL
ncbi:hypothetical protein DIURU_001496 [Diutina rugosa]|uniref:Bacterial surface antigen (D15) domain-containing protein n=1 Tax=Diutina rugosa TaxID=5481 RepID=A0A642UTZ6_DIURU|nr:uncharacterized protein DIURU_001496 [Diutina rugosa]KAA8905423.1 hypothetical protein DIURU_001496 [Diutina rugosa]